MKLSAVTFRLKRTAALLSAATLLPLAASAGTLHHVESSHIAAKPASDLQLAALTNTAAPAGQESLKASVDASLRQQISEVSHQATLVHDAYLQLSRDIASGNERAIAASKARYAAQREAFLKAQQDVRASMLQLRQLKSGGETLVD